MRRGRRSPARPRTQVRGAAKSRDSVPAALPVAREKGRKRVHRFREIVRQRARGRIGEADRVKIPSFAVISDQSLTRFVDSAGPTSSSRASSPARIATEFVPSSATSIAAPRRGDLFFSLSQTRAESIERVVLGSRARGREFRSKLSTRSVRANNEVRPGATVEKGVRALVTTDATAWERGRGRAEREFGSEEA